jgi:small subunit ribosomal protein S20
MPNTKSAKKELRKNKTNKARNDKMVNGVKLLLKKTKKAIESKDKEAKELLDKALKSLDKAAQKGIIKKNTRDRKKSRIAKKFNLAQKQ